MQPSGTATAPGLSNRPSAPGWPSQTENLRTPGLLRPPIAETGILHRSLSDASPDEGRGHRGKSALIDLIPHKSQALPPRSAYYYCDMLLLFSVANSQVRGMKTAPNLSRCVIRALALIAVLLFGAVHPMAAGAMPGPDQARALAFAGDLCAAGDVGAGEKMAPDCPLCHLQGVIQTASPPPEGAPRRLVWLEAGPALHRVRLPEVQWSDLSGAPRGPPETI